MKILRLDIGYGYSTCRHGSRIRGCGGRKDRGRLRGSQGHLEFHDQNVRREENVALASAEDLHRASVSVGALLLVLCFGYGDPDQV